MSVASEARETADTIRLVLEKIHAGELEAPPGMVRQLQGSLIALEALCGRGQQR